MKRPLSRPCPTCGAEQRLVAGETLRAKRHEAGLSLRHVAARAGISYQHLAALELGNRVLLPEMWDALRGVIEGRR